MSFWKKGDKKALKARKANGTDHALPAFTVETEEEAKALFVRFGRLGYDRIYRWADFGGTLEALDEATETMKEFYIKEFAR